ncbi:MAG: serine--tRNA ligase [Candidatus Sumerlaeota bacterium]|nr:serine--tRNA ligase [Candidatus Sumerlaeota bacterium]
MLDARFVEENKDAVAANCRNRNVPVDIENLVALLKARREKQCEADVTRNRQNEVAKQVKSAKTPEERTALVEEGKRLKTRIAQLEAEYNQIFEEGQQLLLRVPNMSHPAAPVGRDDTENQEINRWGEIPKFDFKPRDHVELGRLCDVIDMEAGAEVTGHGFYFLRNEAVFLELALCQYAMRLIASKGYQPNITPDMARASILEGIGFIPRGDETQIYSIANTDQCMIATAEITLGGMLADQILDGEKLPLRLGGLSHCFRTEAGAHGRASKGLYRVHQFTKVEMFAFTKPEDSEALHEEMRAIEEEIFQGLGVPYRVVNICTGDLGGPAYRKYDLEAWMPSRGEEGAGDWGEVTSTSNCTDYQSRRLKIRFRREKGAKPELVHTLNGTAVAISRALIAIMENYQKADGSIDIPESLQSYLPFKRIEPRNK